MEKKKEAKTYTLPFAKKDEDIWLLIKDGKKKVETRAAGPKYQHITSGDILIFSCEGKKFKKTIKNATHFKTLTALFKKYDPEIINPGIGGTKALTVKYQSFTGYTERIKLFGMLAFELEQTI